MARFTVAVLAVMWLTAFAPAPFPIGRRDSKGNLSLAEIQGTWSVIRTGWLRDGTTFEPWGWLKEIRIEKDVLTFVSHSYPNNSPSYYIVIGHSQTPATIDFYYTKDQMETKRVSMGGVIRLKDGQLEILYHGPPDKTG